MFAVLDCRKPRLTFSCILLKIPVLEELVDVLVTVEDRGEAGRRRNAVGVREDSLAAFEVFFAALRLVHGMPRKLASAVVGVSVKRRDYARDSHGSAVRPRRLRSSILANAQAMSYPKQKSVPYTFIIFSITARGYFILARSEVSASQVEASSLTARRCESCRRLLAGGHVYRYR